jgi:ABC-type sugar transport system permease subunit
MYRYNQLRDKSNKINNCGSSNYYTYISYAIFALIFVTAYFWVQSFKLLFTKIFSTNTDSSTDLFNERSTTPITWKYVLLDFAFTIILTIITIVLIITFHPSLTKKDKRESLEPGIESGSII